jgi:hypothetical protein
VNVNRLLGRTAALVLPAALVLGATGTAFAAKPLVTPAPVLTSKPTTPTNSTAAHFTWTAAASTTYKCSLDGGVAATCASPKDYSALGANRNHTFKLTATETNKKPSTVSYTWAVDTVAPAVPTLTRNAPVADPSASSTASFTFADAATDLLGYRCSLDLAAYTACATPLSLSGLGTRTHTLDVKALDKAGNLSAAARSTWTVDVTPPAVPGVVGPGRTSNKQPTITISTSADTASLTCSLDGAAAAACPTSTSWTPASPLSDGDHTLVVVARDALGNPSAPATVLFTVDTTGPEGATLVSAPPALTRETSASVFFADVEPKATFKCALDGGSAAACTSPFSVTGLAEGPHSLDVQAYDTLGNPATSTLHVTWTVDSTAPATAKLLTVPPAYTNQQTATFAWGRTDAATTGFRCSVDGSPFGDCDPAHAGDETVTTVTLSGVTQGTHTFAVQTRDAASNWSDPATYQWVVDLTAPTSAPRSTGVAPGDLGFVNSAPTFAFSSTEPTVAGFLCKVDGGSWASCASGFSPKLADGSHHLWVNTVDQAGNAGTGTPLEWWWVLDTKKPVGTISFPTTLTGTVGVKFAEPVLGVTTSSARLQLAGTTSFVATALSCVDMNGNAASCALKGGIGKVLLRPTARLVPGQKYRLAVSSAVHDRAGNPAVVSIQTYRALRALQETEAAVGQSWQSVSSTSAYGGRYARAHFPNAVASYAYKGTSVTWYTATGPAMGTANVYCGSTLKAKVNNYASSNHWHVARTVTCSSTAANNQLRVVATGLKGSSLGKGTWVFVDAVKVGTTLTSNPSLGYRWGTAPSSLASGGRYALADQAGEAFAVTFRGTSITWRTLLAKNMGKAKVYIDGVYKGTYDQFATTTKAYSRTWKLTDKVHTFKVIATGTRRSGATANRVVLDSLSIG